MKPLPSIEALRQVISYDPETGKLFWLRRDASLFRYPKQAADWNARNAGKEAYTATSNGYHQGSVLGMRVFAHRIAFAMHHGRWAALHIDHKNGDKSDNRIINLREVDHATNMRNRFTNSKNTSGRMGVVWCRALSKWRAQIRYNGRVHHCGYYSDFNHAVDARIEAEKSFGFGST